MDKNIQSDQFFIVAVTIAAALKATLKDAKDISLGAMNAKSVVARAGTNTRSIQPITDYMDHLAKEIIRQVQEVNRRSLEVSQDSLRSFSEEFALSQFEEAKSLGKNFKHIHTINPATEKSKTDLDNIQTSIKSHMRSLYLILDEINNSLMATSVATSKFKLEVGISNTEYEENFTALLVNFESAVSNIKRTISDCKKALSASARKHIK